ncbi:MAG: hypothetical protein A3I66_05130 [Burkholderiales bacterium RIFCSPLOWO2_02_FULL_57_36]|nr:MAG: hypothetical protein A3I66_05130 [Burkholderiales bacterium RIFCSPLOWO2_02_FULL_57_36]
MDKLLSMRVFNEVVELGSFTRAADHLQMSPAVVTRHIAALESQLGTQLLLRTTRSLSLTERGEIYLERSRRILEDVYDTEAVVSSAAKAYSGILRLSSPINFGLHFLPAIMHEFQDRYPDIAFDIMLTDEPIDLVGMGRDIGIALSGNIVNPDTVTRSVLSTQMVLCATPQYLRRHPPLTVPGDLSKHRCVALSTQQRERDLWQLQKRDGSIDTVSIKPAIICNTTAMAYQCVFSHLGIGAFISVIARKALESGQLVRVLDEYEIPGRELLIAYPSRRYLTSKARVFIDFLIAQAFIAQALDARPDSP